MLPNNTDTVFKTTRKPKQLDLLLHYNYGTAAVKRGHGLEFFKNHANSPHPPVPVEASRAIYDGTITIAKHDKT
jgi:hypothetical protein